MKNKYLIKISLIFSFFFLLLLTSLLSFLYIISLKPLKINLLDYFDRKSEIYRKYNIKEIGSVYVSFNKVSKNFEILAEDLIIGDSYLDNILIGLDVTLSENLFDTTLKIFDSRFDISIGQVDAFDSKGAQKFGIDNYPDFFNFFKNIEVINSSVELKLNDNRKNIYIVDFILKGKDDLRILINEKSKVDDNYLLVEKKENIDLYELKLKNFSLEFFNKFLRSNNASFEKLENMGLEFNVEEAFGIRETNEFDSDFSEDFA